MVIAVPDGLRYRCGCPVDWHRPSRSRDWLAVRELCPQCGEGLVIEREDDPERGRKPGAPDGWVRVRSGRTGRADISEVDLSAGCIERLLDGPVPADYRVTLTLQPEAPDE